MSESRERQGLQIVEALLAAGYQLCTAWHNVEPPAFLGHSRDRVLPTLDPFDLYDWVRANDLGLNAASGYWGYIPPPSEGLLFIARGGSWSPGEHRHWPDRFKAAARTLLLSASASAASRQAAGRRVTRASSRRHPHAAAAAGSPFPCLGDLPEEVLLHILRLAAHPLSGWS